MSFSFNPKFNYESNDQLRNRIIDAETDKRKLKEALDYTVDKIETHTRTLGYEYEAKKKIEQKMIDTNDKIAEIQKELNDRNALGL